MASLKKMFQTLLVLTISVSPATFAQTQSLATTSIFQDSQVARNSPFLSAVELQKLVHRGGIKILDVRKKEFYDAGHIPGAVNVWRNDFQTATGFVPTSEEFTTLVRKLGINNSDTVVVYAAAGDHGPANAAYLWWLFYTFGKTDICLLDGGLEAWQSAGFATALDATPHTAGTFQATKPSPELFASMTDVLAAISAPKRDVVILDVRERAEFDGEALLPGAAKKGRIPGAVWFYWGNTLNADKSIKNLTEIRAELAALGVTPDKTVITYCQAGFRAAHTALVLHELLGFKNVKAYAGSWMEWTHNNSAPVDLGNVK